jgi:protein TonB
VPIAAPLLATEAPALEILAPAAAPVAPETTAPEPVEAPVGPLFEMSQVNEPPRIASQVEPSVPDVLQGPLNDVVIVRVLVSQSGHAATVNLLRRSKAGAALDEAVIAAVKQWTFSPARKRGQAVSCWFNVGVPLRRGE